MRVLIVLGVCLVSSISSADPSWDRTYALDGRGGDWVCPDPRSALVVAKGRFTIPWIVTFNEDKRVDIGTITGTVRDSGLVIDIKSTVTPTLPKEVEADRQIVDRIVSDMKIRFGQVQNRLSVEMNAGNCYARWVVQIAGDKGGGMPKPRTVTVDKLPPPPPLAGNGAATWNATYQQRSAYRDDWRCVHSDSVKKLVVANGKFSIPWFVGASGYNRIEVAPIQVAQLDGVIAANGTVKLRMSPSVKELPPEISTGLPKDQNTFAHLVKATPTVKFIGDKGGRLVEITFGKACSIELAATDYKVPVSKTPKAEKRNTPPPELPRVDCDDYDEWDHGDDKPGDVLKVTVAGPDYIYKCTSLGCNGTPGDRGSDWVRIGECR
jgi:hypothetical protein